MNSLAYGYCKKILKKKPKNGFFGLKTQNYLAQAYWNENYMILILLKS